MQAQANTQAAQAAAQVELQKEQALAQGQAQLEQMKAQIEAQKMQQEVLHKKELMALEFQYNMQLKGVEVDGMRAGKRKRDRKDERTKIQASQQSELINQRKTNAPPKKFESAGMDNLGGFGLEQFEPR